MAFFFFSKPIDCKYEKPFSVCSLLTFKTVRKSRQIYLWRLCAVQLLQSRLYIWDFMGDRRVENTFLYKHHKKLKNLGTRLFFFFPKIQLAVCLKAFATFHKHKLYFFGLADKEIKANQIQRATHFSIHQINSKIHQELSKLGI